MCGIFTYKTGWFRTFGQMLGFIFQHHQHHGSLIWVEYLAVWLCQPEQIHGRNQERPAIPVKRFHPGDWLCRTWGWNGTIMISRCDYKTVWISKSKF
jgi:hypothetical protein